MSQIIRRTSTISLVTVVALSCGGVHESSVRADLVSQRMRFGDSSVSTGSTPATQKHETETSIAPVVGAGAGPAAYVSEALRNHPELRAAYARWQASVYRISKARRLPDPMLGFGYFVRSIETRVGPQQARVSLQQSLPWPTKLGAGADAASAQARAKQRQFEAIALTISRRVVVAYWDLWQLRRTRELQREHLEIVRGLSESVSARVSTGGAVLAELQQVELTAARIDDSLRGMVEAERAAEGRLRAAIGSTTQLAVPTEQAPARAVLPQETVEQLARAVNSHPRVESSGFMAQAADFSAEAEATEGLPSLTVGADWILTGEASMPDVMDSGKDAIVIAAGLRLPLWQGSYSESTAAVRADANAERAEQRALINNARAELEQAMADVRDAVRRVQLYGETLIQMAQSAYESVLGAYTVGTGTVAQTLLAQRDLLELQIDLVRARADHARAWARLEEVTGTEVNPAVIRQRGEGLRQ